MIITKKDKMTVLNIFWEFVKSANFIQNLKDFCYIKIVKTITNIYICIYNFFIL